MGLIHIYCGDGKGKTTAGMGLCARAAGAGLRVLIVQFMKGNTSGERATLGLSENITLSENPAQEKFSFDMTSREKAEQKALNEKRLAEETRRAVEDDYDVLFLDEILYAIRAGLLDEEQLLAFLENKPEKLEVILTGQEPSEALIKMADYVSEIKKIKHPYEKGVAARKGIEY